MRKPFDPKLHENNDKTARDIAKKAFLNNYKYKLKDNEDIYGPDLEAFQDGAFLGYVEVEIKQYWKDYTQFPAKFLHIPHRKNKFIDYGNFPVVFCVFSADLKAGFWIEGEDLQECPIITKGNKYVDSEPFFDVALSKMQYFLVEPIGNERDNNESVESQSSQQVSTMRESV
jgi:hypothetical protein